MCKFLSVIVFFSLLCSPVLAQQAKKTTPGPKQNLLNYIESLKKDDDLKNASWGVKVVDCSSNNTVASYQSSKNLIPASILKLVTTGVGALTFGNNHKFTTTLAYSGKIDRDSTLQGYLHLIGGGDPTFGSLQFKNTHPDSIFNYFLNSVKKAGIRIIYGKLIADVSIFDNNEIHDTWEWGDIGNYYGAGTSALSFSENMFSASIKPGNAEKQAGKIENIYPQLPYSSVVNNITTSAKDSKADIVIYSSPMSNYYYFKGVIPVNKDSVVAKGAIQNPALICLNNFNNYLEDNGVSTGFQFEVKTDTSNIIPINNVLAQWESPNYAEIAESTNRFSNNMFADMILKAISAHNNKSEQASFDSGVDEVLKILKNRGIETANIKIEDGSGLSRQNLVSPDFMCQFLSMMYKAHPNFEKFLPSPGEKGTLAGFMSSYQKSRSKVRLKSGSMTGVLSYAGYVKNKKGNTLCVTVITNNFTCKVSKIRPKLEKLIYLISECE